MNDFTDTMTSQIEAETINAAARMLMNDRIWVDAIAFCKVLMQDDIKMTKEEKHAKVKKQLQFIIDDAAGELVILCESVLDIAIKLAVIYLKEKAKAA